MVPDAVYHEAARAIVAQPRRDRRRHRHGAHRVRRHVRPAGGRGGGGHRRGDGQHGRSPVRRRRGRPPPAAAANTTRLRAARVLIVVAGMEGALPSVVAGLVRGAGDRRADERRLRRQLRRHRGAARHAEQLRQRRVGGEHRQRLRRRVRRLRQSRHALQHFRTRSRCRALEFDRIVSIVAGLAVTPTGRERLEALAPLTEPARVGAAQARHDRRRALPAESPGLPAARAVGARGRSSTRWHVEGRALEPLRLLGLADYLESIEATRDASSQSATEPLPDPEAAGRGRRLVPGRDRRRAPQDRAVAARWPTTPARRSPASATGCGGSESKLRSTLESFLRERETSKYLQEQVVTDRNGRYVLMVRAEHRGAIPGHRARRVGQRRQPVPRAARHGRDQQRHRRARGAGGRGGPPHPARADRRVPRRGPTTSSARSTWPPSSTSSRRGRASRR